MLLTFFVAAAVIVSGIAAWKDSKTGLIPNWLTAGTLVAAVAFHFFEGLHYAGLRAGLLEAGLSIAGAVFCALGPLVMFVAGGMGGGDLKLFAALGALLQPLLGIETEAYGFFAAAIIALARLAYQGRLFAVLGATGALMWNPFRSRENRREVPREALTWFRLGPAIFIGTLAMTVIHGYDLLSH
jgi:prepilin peptidase CpaA